MTYSGRQFSRLCFVLTAGLIVLTTAIWPRYQRTFTEAPIAWDVSGYYLYLPAIIIHNDLRELRFLPEVIEHYRPSHAPDQAFPYGQTDQGRTRYVMKYPAGMALMYLPFFLLAHAVALAGPWPADGFSMPYQVAIQWGGMLVAILGLWLLRRSLVRFFPDRAAGLGVVGIGLGTNFYNYATYDSGNTHVWLFTLLVAIVWLTARWYQRPTCRHSVLLGLCIGLAALARPTEIIYALVPLTWGLNTPRKTMALWRQHFSKIMLTAAMVILVGSIQLVYWKYASGEWVVYSYREQGFSFLRPHLADVFFSYRKGWLVYTPLLLFALAGLPSLWWHHRPLFWPVAVFFFVNTWIVASWDIWWYGGAFGQRAMIQSYALLALGLTAFLSWVSLRKWRRWVFLPIALLFAAGNLFQTWQAHNGPFETEAMNKAYFRRILLKTHSDPYDRLLLDRTDVPPADLTPTDTLLFEDFEHSADTATFLQGVARSGQYSLYLLPGDTLSASVYLPRAKEMAPGAWLECSGWFFGTRKEWQDWWMPQFVVFFEKDGQVLHTRMVRPFRVMGENEWKKVPLYLQIPEMDFDHLRIFLLNPNSPSSMHLDDLTVVRLRSE